MGVRVEVGEGESLASALRRFRKYVGSANVLYEYRRHAAFTKRREERRRRKGNAKLRKHGMLSWYERNRREEAEASWPDPPRPA